MKTLWRAQRYSSIEPRLIALVAIATATALCSLFTLRHDPSQEELQVSSIALSVALALPFIWDLVESGVVAAIHGANVTALGLIYWILLDLVQRLHEIALPAEIIFQGFFATALFATGIFAGAAGTSRSRLRWLGILAGRKPSPNRLTSLCLFCVGISLCYYIGKSGWDVSAAFASAQEGRFATLWSRPALGDTWAFLEAATYFGYVGPILLILQYRTQGRLSLAFIFAGLLVALDLMFISSDGSRRSIGMILGSSMLLWMVTSQSGGSAVQRGLPWYRTAMIVVGLYVLVIFLNGILQTRAAWQSFDFSATDYLTIRVDDNFFRLCQTISAIPSEAPYAGISPITFAIVRPIPRALWPGKPVEPSFTIHGHLGIGHIVSLSSSIVGELYSCGGYLSIMVGGVVYGRLCRYWSLLLRHARNPLIVALYVIGLGTLFVGLRSMNDLVLFTYPLGAALIVLPLARSGGNVVEQPRPLGRD